MECDSAASVAVLVVAWPLPFNEPVPMLVAPSRKLTEPVGMVVSPDGPATVAVKITD